MAAGEDDFRWQLGGAQIAYSRLADGDMREPANRHRWLQRLGAPAASVHARQQHGTEVLVVDRPPATPPAVDGFASRRTDLSLWAFGADCPGVVLVAADALAIGHCGWRGTAAGMVASLVRRLAGLTPTAPATWQAFIGPGISASAYEVDQPVLAARDWPATALQPGRPGHAQLDLADALAEDLRRAGIPRCRRAGHCTARHPDLHSFRHQGPGSQQALVVWRPTRTP